MTAMAEVLAGHQHMFHSFNGVTGKRSSACSCGVITLVGDYPIHLSDILSEAGFGQLREAQEVAWAKGATSAGMNLMALQAAGINPNPYRSPE